MDLVTADEATQRDAFLTFVLANPVVRIILERLPELGLPDAWLAAGALFQSVWNGLSERDPQTGIRDYDVNYCDLDDVSWEGEDRVIAATRGLFADLGVEVEVRNEARVHLWYEQKFGVPCPPYRSTRAAIDTFPNRSSCFGVRPSLQGLDGPHELEVYAPFGYDDLFGLVVRPNPVQAPREVYEAKAARWVVQWPRLTVVPWPS